MLLHMLIEATRLAIAFALAGGNTRGVGNECKKADEQ
jgi:hypothetical protein